MNEPRTAREALIAEMLGDLDGLLARIEAIPAFIDTSEERFINTITALDKAGDKYRLTIAEFTELAKADLAEYLDRKTIEVSLKSAEDQRVVLQKVTQDIFRSEVSNQITKLNLVINDAAKQIRYSRWSRFIEYAITALISSGFTVGLLYVFLKIH